MTRFHVQCGLAAALIAASAICFTAAITYGTFRLWAPAKVGVFYDYQANSLLHGRLDVPDEAIHNEAFIVNGKTYGYFGPTPAILRMPFIAAGAPYGRLTRTFMLAEYVGALAGAYLILREAERRLGGDGNASRFSTLLLLTNAGLGSTLFFLAARPMMYHEAVLCGITFAVWSCWCSLRQLDARGRRWWVGALGCGVLSIQSRPTVGFFALTLLGAVAAWQGFAAVDPDGPADSNSTRRRPRTKALAVAALAGVGALSLNGVAYLKFRTFDPAPYQFSRPYTPERYARVGDRKFHAANMPWGFYSYLLRPNFRFDRRFPYFLIGTFRPAARFPDARIDLPDFLLPIPYAMPGLIALASFGALGAFVNFRRARGPLAVLWLAGLPMSVLLFAFIAIAQRYSGDFCPLLFGTATFGIVGIDRARGRRRTILRMLATALTAASVYVTGALVFDYQANWGPVPPAVHSRYQHIRDEIDSLLAPPHP